MRVKCLAQEHNTMSPARAGTRSARSGVERTNHEATAPPFEVVMPLLNCTTPYPQTGSVYDFMHFDERLRKNSSAVYVYVVSAWTKGQRMKTIPAPVYGA